VTEPVHDDDPRLTDERDTREQRIHVESGVAYGVQGADLHVWGQRMLPARLLGARDEATGYTGSAAELDHLRQWRSSVSPLAVRWLYGPAEAAPAGLVATFASEAAADNWKVLVATLGSVGTAPVAGESQDLGLGAAEGVVLVINDADRWPWNSLALLLSRKLFRRAAGGTRTRILMIGRTLDRWPEIQHKIISSGQPATSTQRLRVP
jgi:hypothetical protein